MSKWEEKYNEYKDGGIDKIINELKAKGISTKEDKKEYKKLNKIKDKMPQVKNVIEYRDTIKDELKSIKEENNTRKTLVETSRKKEELSKKIEKYQTRWKELEKEIKNEQKKENPDSSKIAKLNDEKSKISEDMPKAQDEMNEHEDSLKKAFATERKLSRMPQEEMNNKIFELQNKISKCNLVAHNLLNGLSWDAIDMKLDNWKDKKFTSKDGKLEKDIEMAKKTREKKVKDFKLDMSKINNLDESQKSDNNGLALTFADKHPRLARIGNFFKKIRDRFSKKEEVKEEIPKEKNSKEEKNLTFKEYIKYVAEYGKEDARKMQLNDREDLKEKLSKMREENRANEAEKFGQDYADKSDYRNKDEEESR